MAESRDDFPKPVADALGKRAAYICSNPDCRVLTIAPSDESQSKFLYLGKSAHICAAASGGPRYSVEMTPEERKAASNGIFLCSNCADMIDKNNGIDFSVEHLRQWKKDHDKWVAANLNKRGSGVGGEGGGGTIIGERGTVIGGRGGDGGVAGIGGKGGSGFIQGNDGLIIGGDGGNCGTPDGRGGRPARGPTERYGFSTGTWGFGRGGSGANHPEYNRRLGLLKTIRTEYIAKFPGDVPFIESGVDLVPVEWVNQRLAEYCEIWRVELGLEGYLLPALQPSDHSGSGKSATIRALLQDHSSKEPSTVDAAPTLPLPVDWLNDRLLEMGTTWRVQLDRGKLQFVEFTNAVPVSPATKKLESKEKPPRPRGIALILCNRVDWTQYVAKSSFPRSFTCTFDSLDFDAFPHVCSPFAAYVLFAGSGCVAVSLKLTAPNDEILWEQQIVSDSWGEIGTCEASITVSNLTIPHPGVYRWRLCYEQVILLERPMIFRLRSAKADADKPQDGTHEVPRLDDESSAATIAGPLTE